MHIVRALTILTLCCLLVAGDGLAGDVSGRIKVVRTLTKTAVLPVATAYRRGVVVAPASNSTGSVAAELGRIAIYLETDLPLSANPVTAVIEQRQRRFVTETVVVPKGSRISFPNLDPIFHNVFSLSKTKTFDLGNYPKGSTRFVKLDRPGLVKVYCHLHPDMSAVIMVTPNDHATKPNADGSFSLPNVPPGEHTLVVWHKSAGFFRKPVRLGESGSVVVNFEIPIDKADKLN
ncbi:MAG: carboxypeptidase regulatory-like domain-containing protein [Acidobacteria bacterium]|nr:carboxypeptidase regulatory-like domain-containing protein [Acidobacteriota bacterium]MDA1235325.1 carboxypeptidase regulatory-like domain-containing protein [Acidobacteriota bacterium]